MRLQLRRPLRLRLRNNIAGFELWYPTDRLRFFAYVAKRVLSADLHHGDAPRGYRAGHLPVRKTPADREGRRRFATQSERKNADTLATSCTFDLRDGRRSSCSLRKPGGVFTSTGMDGTPYTFPMKHKRGVMALIVAFIFIFGFEFAWHGVIEFAIVGAPAGRDL